MKRYIRAKIVNLLDEDYDTLKDIALDPSTDHDTLVELANTDLAWSVVKNPNLSEDILNILAKYNNRGIRHHVVLHPNATTEIIDKVLDTELEKIGTGYSADYYSIFYDIVESPMTTVDMLWKIAKSSVNRDIKAHIYDNPNITDDLIKYLQSIHVWNECWRFDKSVDQSLNHLGSCTWTSDDGCVIADAIKKYNPYRTPKEIADYIVYHYDEFINDYDLILNRVSN